MDDNCRPRRPLSGYNIFFQLERDRIVNDEPDRLFTAEDVATKLRVYGSGIDKPKRSKKPHRKIEFAQLAKRIACKWNRLSRTERSVFEDRSKIEKEKYRSKLGLWSKRANKKDAVTSVPVSQTDASLTAFQPATCTETVETGHEKSSTCTVTTTSYDLHLAGISPTPVRDDSCMVDIGHCSHTNDTPVDISPLLIGSPNNLEPRPLHPFCFPSKNMSAPAMIQNDDPATLCPIQEAPMVAANDLHQALVGYQYGMQKHSWITQQDTDCSSNDNQVHVVLPVIPNWAELDLSSFQNQTISGTSSFETREQKASTTTASSGDFHSFNGFNSIFDTSSNTTTTPAVTTITDSQGRCLYKLQQEYGHMVYNQNNSSFDPVQLGIAGYCPNLVDSYQANVSEISYTDYKASCECKDTGGCHCNAVGDVNQKLYVDIAPGVFPRIVSDCSVAQSFEDSLLQQQPIPSSKPSPSPQPQPTFVGDSKSQMIARLPVASDLCNLF
jgi:hypothetical protein